MKKLLILGLMVFGGAICASAQSNSPANFDGKTKVFVPRENATYVMDNAERVDKTDGSKDIIFENVIAKVNGNLTGGNNGNGPQEIVIIKGGADKKDLTDAAGNVIGATCAAGKGLCVIIAF